MTFMKSVLRPAVRRIGMPVLAVLALAQPGLANTIKDQPVVTLDPAKAYILVETPGTVPITLFRVPTEAAREEDRAKRAEEFAKAHQKWEKDFPKWQKRVAHLEPKYRDPNFKAGPTDFRPPRAPVEPQEDSFPWPPLELQHMLTLGPKNRFSKDENRSLYLQEVLPGEFAYYGRFEGGLGVCACLGTVKFDVPAGKITALRYDLAFLDKDGQPRDYPRDFPRDIDSNDAVARMAMIIGNASPRAMDPRLPAEMFQAAEFYAMPALPNWLGGEINRLQPIPGVLAYERSRIIDLKAAPVPDEAPEAATPDSTEAEEVADVRDETSSETEAATATSVVAVD